MAKTDADNNSTQHDMKIFRDIRNHIKKKINNNDNNFLGDSFRSQKDEVYELIRRSVEMSESNSAVVSGPPGYGKTALINNVLKELSAEGIINEESASVIKLNGLLHTDDRLALQDISRQLNIAENMDTKLQKSFQENLVYLLEKLKDQKSGMVGNSCTVFILDEFQLFCEHKNQILLYNLFDITQSAKAPICVVGLTYWTDVMDLLEKRVLSRFSHRVIHMAQTPMLDERLKLFQDIFTLDVEDLPHVDKIYKFLWNSRTEELVKSKEVQDVLKMQLDLNASQSKFRSLLLKLVSNITFEQPLLSVEDFVKSSLITDPNVMIFSRLSQLEVALVIAIKHQTVNYDREPFNFEMIYTQYLKFTKRSPTNLVVERSVVMKAFQRLQECEIIVPLKKSVGNALGKVPLEYQLYNFCMTEDQVNEGVKQNKNLLKELQQWSMSSV